MLLFDWREACYWVARRRPLRRVAGLLLRSLSRRLLTRLDQEDAVRAQTRVLLGLVHRARQTPFGRDHDFARMRTPEDYRRLVPLSSPTVPVVGGHDAAHRAAWRLALALACQHGARLPLVPGGFVVLDEQDDFAARLPYLIAPYGSRDVGPTAGAGAVCLAGSVDRLLNCCEKTPPPNALPGTERGSKAEDNPVSVSTPDILPPPSASGRELGGGVPSLPSTSPTEAGSRRLADRMPDLALVLYQRDPGASVDPLRAELRESTLLLETATLLGAPIAVEDPRHGRLRLLADHGVYFEFVSLDQVHHERPERLQLDQVKLSEPYELVITSSAGLWACRTGQLICFDRLNPPLVTLTGPIPPAPVAVSATAVLTLPAPPVSRPRNDGIPAVPTGMFGHNPWSAHADRG